MAENADEELLRALRDPLLWEPPALVSREEIAAMFAAVDEEDAAADALCRSLLTGPPALWRERVRGTPGTRTVGMVRQLLQRVPQLLECRPADALHATSLAVTIADILNPQDYWPDHVLLAQGQALREHARVLSCLGRCAAARDAMARAERVFAQVPDAHGELLDSGEPPRAGGAAERAPAPAAAERRAWLPHPV